MVNKKKNNKSSSKPKLNGWHVLMRFIDGLFDLVNTNRIFPAFGLAMLAIFGLIIWRLPESDLADIIKILIRDVFLGKGGLLAIIVLSNLGWIYLYNRMRILYRSEIDRLSKLRSELMHNPDRISIDEHRSSDSECEESILIPPPSDFLKDKDKDKDKDKGSK